MSKSAEEGGISFIRNFGNYQPDYLCVMGLNFMPWKPNLRIYLIIQGGLFTAWPRSCSSSLGRRFSSKQETSRPVEKDGPPCIHFYILTKFRIVKVPLTNRSLK